MSSCSCVAYTAANNYGSYSGISHNIDVLGAVRTSRYPSGLRVADAFGCSNACVADPECYVAVWNQGGGDYCWPLKSYADNRIGAAGSRAVLYPLRSDQQPTSAPAAPSSGGGAGGGFDRPTCPTCEIP